MRENQKNVFEFDSIHLHPIAQEKSLEYFTTATIYEESEDYYRAATYYQLAQMFDPYSPEIFLSLGRVYDLLGEIEAALIVLENGRVRNPDRIEFLEELSTLYIKRAHFDRAIHYLGEISKVRTLKQFEIVMLAELYRRTLEFDKAIETLKNYQDVYEPRPEIYEEIGKIYLAKYDLDNAEKAFKQLLELDPTDHRIYFILGGFSISRKELELAEDYFSKAISYHEGNTDYWVNLLMVQYELEKYQEVISGSADALSIFPEHIHLYLLQSDAYSQIKDYYSAISSLEILLENDPDYLVAYISLGFIYHQLEDWENSEKAYKMAFELAPSDARVLNNYAYMLAVANKNLDFALEMATKAIEMEPEVSAYQDTYGWVLYRLGRYEEAREAIELSIALYPNSAEVHANLGYVLEALGEKDKAREAFMRAYELEPENEKFQRLVE